MVPPPPVMFTHFGLLPMCLCRLTFPSGHANIAFAGFVYLVVSIVINLHGCWIPLNFSRLD